MKLKHIALALIVIIFIDWCNVWSVTKIDASILSKPPANINGFINKCGYSPTVDGYIPEGIPPCSTNGYKFNSEFFSRKIWPLNDSGTKTVGQRFLVVYGEPSKVGSIQQFKKGWQSENVDSKILNEGHFKGKDSSSGEISRGEWRYLGFTRDGNPFSNIHFIVDSWSGNELGTKHWIYQPWMELPLNYKYKPKTPGAVYKNPRPDVMSPQFDHLEKWINQGLGFKITQGVKYEDKYTVLPNERRFQDPRNYMSIDQEPTTREGGFGNLYHYSWETHSIWYHTFSLPKLKGKQPVEAACIVEPVSSKPIPIGKSTKLSVDVKVQGMLKDSLVFGDRLSESKYYHRKDIKEWRFDLIDPKTGQYIKQSSASGKDGIVRAGNEASAEFTIEVDLSKLDRSSDKVWTYTSNAGVFTYFNDHTSSNPAFSMKYCNLTIPFEPTQKQSMLSSFGIVPAIQFEKKSQFTAANVGYEDFSYGQDADFYEFVITNEQDGTSLVKKFDPAIPEIKAPKKGFLDQNAVNSYLFNFMASAFAEEELRGESVTKTFSIIQKIVDRDADVNRSSESSKRVTVVQTPPASCKPSDSSLQRPKQYISPKADWPLDWYDVVPLPVSEEEPERIPSRNCEEAPSYAEFDKRVYIDGVEIDAAAFYSGSYTFGEALIGLREVKATFTAPDGSESYKIQHIVVHDSKPRVSIKLEGLFKQNRKMSAFDRSAESNDRWVEEKAPLEITTFSFVDPDDQHLKCRTGYCENNLSEKMFMYKQPGVYKMSIAAKRVIHYGDGQSIVRYSDPYLIEYEIMPDHRPAIIAHAYNAQISRLDPLQLYYDVQSTDGDFIANQKLEIYYDSNNDGAMDQIVFQSDGDVTELPLFSKLGQYKIIASALEGTNEEKLLEHSAPNDDQKHQIESYFFVDNYAPSSDLYVDVPAEKQRVDVFMMLDAKLEQAATDYIRHNRISLTNQLTQSNVLANLDIWDMKTYRHSQSANTLRNTGSSYPDTSINYHSSGYAGTLQRERVTNAPYSYDEGQYQTKTDSATKTDSCNHTKRYSYDSKGNYRLVSDSGNCPGAVAYSDGKYAGTLNRTGETGSGCPAKSTPNSSCTGNWTAHYAGTVYWTREVWVPDIRIVNNYTGYYSGTIYKDVRQPYDPSFLSTAPVKYVVYVADTNTSISGLTDLLQVMDKHHAKVILIGSESMKEQIDHEKFILNNRPIKEMIDKAIEYMAEGNPAVPKTVRLAGEEIELRTASFDAEGDMLPVEDHLLQVVQDPYHFDNSFGFESFGGKPLISEKTSGNWHPFQAKLVFDKPGKYTFYRVIKDLPVSDLHFEQYRYFSNVSAVQVLVHRKPIPDIELDFDYLLMSNRYQTKWTDLSYDLDHNITRAATDRGIQARSIKLSNQETGEVYTKIPQSLDSGTYVLDYIVQDLEGAWSEPLRKTYVLPSSVPVQMKSKLKPAYSGFSLASLPASESIIAHELWTRYPYAISLHLKINGLFNRAVPYYTGVKKGNDIFWHDESFIIPNTMPDGAYTFTVTGMGSVDGSLETKSFQIRVATPITLKGSINAADGSETNTKDIIAGKLYRLEATTSKYPDQAVNPDAATVTLFKGTAYQRTVTLTSTTVSTEGFGQKNWHGMFSASGVPDGRYKFEWRSRTPNGNVETVVQEVTLSSNRPPHADFHWEPQPVFEGDTVSFIAAAGDPDGDQLHARYELISPSGDKEYRTYTLHPPYVQPDLRIRLNEIGSWQMKLTVSDGKAAPVTAIKTIKVNELYVVGSVLHTELWNEHRRNYNLKKSGNAETPRSYHVFWAGEKFLFKADTTVTNSLTRADRVEVEFGKHTVVLSPLDANRSKWGGELWDESFEKLKDGSAVFTFSAYYNNGTVKKSEVEIEVLGRVSQMIGVHRVK